jgi:hypothetical protein
MTSTGRVDKEAAVGDRDRVALPTVGSVWRNIPTDKEATVIRVADVPVPEWDTQALGDGATRPGHLHEQQPIPPLACRRFLRPLDRARQAVTFRGAPARRRPSRSSRGAPWAVGSGVGAR